MSQKIAYLEKIISLKEIPSLKEQLQGKSLATLNGSFDLMHAGHLYILQEAAKTADVLLLAVNSDASVKRYKGPEKPIIPLQERMQMLAAIGFVDYVCAFEEDTPCEFLKLARPDVHVNGAEYGSDCVEAKTVEEIGAKLHLVKRIPGLASSDIIKKIQKLGADV